MNVASLRSSQDNFTLSRTRRPRAPVNEVPASLVVRRDAERAAACQRQRVKRSRDRQGAKVYRVEACESRLIEALIRSSLLTQNEFLRRHFVECALQQVIERFVQQWLSARA